MSINSPITKDSTKQLWFQAHFIKSVDNFIKVCGLNITFLQVSILNSITNSVKNCQEEKKEFFALFSALFPQSKKPTFLRP